MKPNDLSANRFAETGIELQPVADSQVIREPGDVDRETRCLRDTPFEASRRNFVQWRACGCRTNGDLRSY